MRFNFGQRLLRLLILVGIVPCIWFAQTTQAQAAQSITVEQTVEKIKNGSLKEINFKQSQVELVDNTGAKFFADVDSNGTRESLLKVISEYNELNQRNPVKISEEPASSGFYWIFLLNALPFLIIFGLSVFAVYYLFSIKKGIDRIERKLE